MRLPVRRHAVPAVLALAIVTAACSSAAPSKPTPPPASPAPSGAPASPGIPSADPNAATYWLRMITTQALPPLNLFGGGAPLVITGSGLVVTPGPVPAIFPGPLVMPLISRTITDAGRAKILQLATSLGLLGRQTDFSANAGLAGGIIAHVEITVDGRLVTLSGSPDATIECVRAPCNPAPATPEAFGTFWRQLLDPTSWLGSELGAEAPYTPTVYSILVGSAPAPDPNLGANIVAWPLDASLATFGTPVVNGQARCATVTGDTATTLGRAFAKANALSQWTQAPTANAAFGLTVRALVPGEDACREVFGVGG
jgi:hypothetical protein